MANTVTVITNTDLGATLEVLDTKLEISLSQESGNLLVKKADGLYAEAPVLGSMAQEDVEDYLTKAEIEADYATKDGVQGDLAGYAKISDFDGKLGLEDKSDYYDAQAIDQLLANLPADQFLAGAELVEEDGAPILKLTLAVKDGQGEDVVVSVNLQDLIPVTVKEAGGLKGDGTQANPLEIDAEDAADVLGLGTMAGEDKDDYYTKVEADAEFLSRDELTVTLKDLAGNVIGVISEAPVEP